MSDERGGERRGFLRWLAGGGFLAGAALVVRAEDRAEEAVDLKKVPRVVLDAAERILPKATWHSAVRVDDEKNVAWELDGSDGKERDVTVLVTSAGKVVEIETQLKVPTNVPEAVLESLKKRWPKFVPNETHRIRLGKDLQRFDDGDTVYDLRGAGGMGRDIQAQVGADGEILESMVELQLENVPAAVTAALKAARPRFEIGTAYGLRDGRELFAYHFEGTGPKGRDRTISVTPDGKQVEVVE